LYFVLYVTVVFCKHAFQAACQAVTAIMQYFFLASFCWMLCEGIMLYLMLVLVFSMLSKKWWFFLILGWCECLQISESTLHYSKHGSLSGGVGID